MGKLRKAFAWIVGIPAVIAIYYSITRFYIGYLTTPRGSIPFYVDAISGGLAIGLAILVFLTYIAISAIYKD